MFIKKTLVLCLLAMVAIGLGALEDNTHSSIGLHFGTSSGNGYAMRWMGPSLGLQATLGAYTSGSNEVKFNEYYYDYDYEAGENEITVTRKGRSTSGTAALNGLIMLDHFNRGRLYIMAGGSYTYYREKRFSALYQKVNDQSYNYRLVPNSVSSVKNTEHRWTAGIGPGVELGLSRHFRISFEVPITYNNDDEIIMYIPQVGFYYYFN